MKFEKDHNDSVVTKFKMLTLQGTVDEYLQKFKDLRALTLMKNLRVPKDLILECYNWGGG